LQQQREERSTKQESRTGDKKFTSSSCSMSCGAESRIGTMFWTPALLMRIETSGYVSTNLARSATDDTSAEHVLMPGKAAAATASFCSLRPTTMTRLPDA
jgi:hypothetical protein